MAPWQLWGQTFMALMGRPLSCMQALVPAVMALRPRFAVAAQRAAEELAEEQGEPIR